MTEPTEKRQAYTVLAMNTLAFTICFACWMLNGVLITFLIDNGAFEWSKSQIGWLIGIPVLTGALMRLPVGVMTDKYGGRKIFALLMLLSAVPMYMVSMVNSYTGFMLTGLGFGLCGASFAVGIAYTAIFFEKQHQGTALGIFGAGNAGAAITLLVAPSVLKSLTAGGYIDGWRTLPKIYAAGLVLTAFLFYLFTYERKVDQGAGFTLAQRLAPLKHMRVWRFGMYYFLVFGGFVALSQWLVPYYVNAYATPIATAGLLAAIFSFPSGVIRALGGWMSDRWGARIVMYGVLASCPICCVLLIFPRMDIQSPGQGVMAAKAGTVTEVSTTRIVAAGNAYDLIKKDTSGLDAKREGQLIWPTSTFWQEPVVKAGDTVKKKQLLARGVTHIYFQANIWIFTGLVFVVGIAMGIGMAAVYKHIPDYFPNDVGVVGGIVGVLGGLGGFFCPILFGYLLEGTGIWTTCWMFFTVLSAGCLVWMHQTIRNMVKRTAPELLEGIELREAATDAVPCTCGADRPPIEKVREELIKS